MIERALIGAMLASLAVVGVTGQAPQTTERPPTTTTTTPRSPAPPTPPRTTPRTTTTRGSEQSRAQARAVFLEACGRCHPPERVTATRRTKAQWEESINAMVTARGATLTADQYDIVLRYLVAEHGTQRPAAAATGGAGPAANASPGTQTTGTRRAGGAGAGAATGRSATAPAGAARAGQTAPTAPPPRPRGGAGPDDKHIVDAAAAMRGRTTYAAACVQCHGPQARGTERGANLVRSLVLLRDRDGSEIGPFLRKGHQTQGGGTSAGFTDAQLGDLSHFLHERLNDTLRGSPIFTVQNVLTGDRQAGAAYFNGAGGCRQCHSATGDLAGIGTRYDPPALQQRFLFPRPPGRGPRGGAGSNMPAAKPVTVTVTTAASETTSGVLVQLDDFHVSLRDASGQYRSWKRVPGLTVAKQDPYAAHVALLDTYTDKDIHDVVAYLESLK